MQALIFHYLRSHYEHTDGATNNRHQQDVVRAACCSQTSAFTETSATTATAAATAGKCSRGKFIFKKFSHLNVQDRYPYCFSARIRSFREGNAFTRVCLSVCLFAGGSPDLFKLVHLRTPFPPPSLVPWTF